MAKQFLLRRRRPDGSLKFWVVRAQNADDALLYVPDEYPGWEAVPVVERAEERA